MIIKIKNTVFILTLLTSIFCIVKYYFSEKNINFTNESRNNYLLLLDNNKNDLPLLQNDTSNIIVYNNELNEFSNKKKRFWEKLLSNSDE